MKRARRRSFKRFKRRPMMRRGRRMAKVRPDGMHKEAITIRRTMLNLTPQSAAHKIHWFTLNPTNSDFNTGISTNNTQHESFANLYKFYMPYGLKIKYIPYTYGQIGTNTIAVRSAYAGTQKSIDQTVSAIAEPLIRNAPDYQPLDPVRPWKRYIRLSKYISRQKIGWLPTTDEVPDAEKMLTQLYVEGAGFNQDAGYTPIGQLYITYYVKFKTRNYVTNPPS